MTTKETIRGWLKRGQKENKTHMIVVCDTYDYEDYPVYVSEKESVYEVRDKYNGKNMQKIMEVYNLKESIDKQLGEFRAFNY